MSRRRSRGRTPATTMQEVAGTAMHVQVDIRKLTFDDLVLLEDLEGGTQPTVRQLRDLLNRAVVGGIGSYTLEQAPALVNAIQQAIKGSADPKA